MPQYTLIGNRKVDWHARPTPRLKLYARPRRHGWAWEVLLWALMIGVGVLYAWSGLFGRGWSVATGR